jgi:hypothetical protein|tara:strand:- start:727 stop:1218 length:492 start_codon:yes stop_codon:yes gene_type:complete
MKRFKSSNSKFYKCSKKVLWQTISSPNYLNNIHPYCEKNSVIYWENDRHEDRLVYLNGLTYERKFTEWKTDEGYDLWIGNDNKKQSFVEWRIKEEGNGVRLSITVYPFLLSTWPKALSFLPYFLYINIKLKSYLYSVLTGIEWFIDKKTPVPKNKFGKHSWFS